jgi:hypothetical protein
MKTTMPLYTSLAPDAASDLVFERKVAKHAVTIALRPVSLPADWTFLGKWLSREFANRQAPGAQLPEKHLRETFSTMLQCDFAQPFVGLINGQPAFLIEICDGDKQCEGLEEGPCIPEEGDHMIRLILSPTIIHIRHLPLYAMAGSLHYFFSHSQVQRIVWTLHEKDRHNIKLAKQLKFIKSTGPNRRGIQVYLYSRENLERFSATFQRQTQKQT